jgi:hypothetical protein
MKKIGILTFHRSLNYGAFMQAYSLISRLSEDFPNAEIEIIDYTTKRIQRKYSYNLVKYVLSPLWDIKKNNIIPVLKAIIKNFITILSSPSYLKRRQVMRESFEKDMKKIKLSDNFFCSDSYKQLFKYINKVYDVVIVGSDCVWEFNNYPFPNAYYLGEDLQVKKLSYAACAQGIIYKNLSEEQKEYMKKSWNSYEYLGTRDTATEVLLKSVDTQLSVYHNCDPTVFLDIDRIPVDINYLKAKFTKAGIDLSKPIVGLMGNEYVGRLCKEIFEDQYQIVSLYDDNQYADFYLYDLSPFEWAKSFSLFSVVFTSKYHGTLLSLKNGISPLSFDFFALNSNYSDNGRTKIQDLYKRLGLMEHYFIGKKQYTLEEKEKIKEKALEFMNNNKADIIQEALEKEAKSYESFCNELQKIIQ